MNYKNLSMFMIILFGFVLNVISMQIVGSSFRHLQGALNVEIDQISYMMSAYLMAEVVIIPFSGWLARLISIRLLFLCGLSGFIIASLGCAATNNFYLVVAFRAMQGITGGALMPIMFSCIYLLFDKKQIPLILAITATIGVSSIAFGPPLGGWMTDVLGWRWMFLYNIPVGLFILILGYFFIDLRDREPKLFKQIDYAGIILLAVSLLLLLITLEEGAELDWFASTIIRFSSILCVITFSLFFYREITAKNPVIDLNVFKNRNFSIGCVNVVVFGVSIYAPIFMLPVFLGEVRGIGPWEIGSMVSIMGLAWMATGPFVGILLNTIGSRAIILLGCILIFIGTWWMVSITSEFGFDELFWPQVLRGVGSQLLWIGNQYIAMLYIPRSGIQNAASMFNLILRLGGAVAIAVTNIFLDKMQIIYYGSISNAMSIGVESLSGANQKFQGLFQNFPILPNFTPDFKTLLAAEILGQREGFIMALNNITFVIMWFAIIPVVLLPFCKSSYKKIEET